MQQEPLEKDHLPLSADESEDSEADEALDYANSFIASDLACIDQQLLGQLSLAALDKDSYDRNKGKYADVKAFTEAACSSDASIEADLKAALSKHSMERSTMLNDLRDKLGKNSQRKQQLGDLMLLHLLTRQGTSAAVKDCIGTACLDFVTIGHSELKEFIERCSQGQTVSMTDAEPDLCPGLIAAKKEKYTAALTVGIILKLGYSSKPACVFNTKLDHFDNFKQRKDESAPDYLNRFSALMMRWPHKGT